jgi:hypothetical protein
MLAFLGVLGIAAGAAAEPRIIQLHRTNGVVAARDECGLQLYGASCSGVVWTLVQCHLEPPPEASLMCTDVTVDRLRRGGARTVWFQPLAADAGTTFKLRLDAAEGAATIYVERESFALGRPEPQPLRKRW